MIKHLSLTNFKCYRQQDLKFNKLTVFSGMNAAGKTTAIQALCYLRQSTFGVSSPKAVPVNGKLVSSGTVDDVIYSEAPRTEATPMVIRLEGDSADQTCCLSCTRFQPDHPMSRLALCVTNYEYAGIGNPLGDGFVYLGAERICPKSSYSIPSDESKVRFNMFGPGGEYTAWHLNRSDDETPTVRPLLYKNGANNAQPDGDMGGVVGRPLLTQCVSQELGLLGRNLRIIPTMDDQLQRAGFRYSFLEGNDYGLPYRPENVGFGLTYVLPVVTALLTVPRGALVLIENPESHLHPKGQVAIGEFIARIASAGVQVVIETHSDHVLNGIRLAVCRKKIAAADIQMNFVINNGTFEDVQVLTPQVQPDGMIDAWPEGFFDEYENVLGEMLSHMRG